MKLLNWFLIIAIFILFCSHCTAEQEWTAVIENGYSVKLLNDSFGNLLLLGNVFSLDDNDKQEGMRGKIVILSKFSADGKLIWQKKYGTWGFDIPTDMEIDSEDNIYIAGYTNGYFDDVKRDIQNRVKRDYNGFVLKINVDGNIISKHQLINDDKTEDVKIEIDSKDNVIVSIFKRKLNDIDVQRNYLEIISYKTNFEIEWKRRIYAKEGDVCLNRMCIDNDDRIYSIFYFFEDYYNPKTKFRNQADNYIVKLSNMGNILWEKQIGEKHTQERLKNVVIDNDNNLFILTTSTGVEFLTYLIKIDLNGELLWQIEIPSIEEKQISINNLIFYDNEIYLIGRTGVDERFISLDEHANEDIVFLKYDTNGKIIYKKIIKTEFDSIGKDICIIDSKVYIAGEFEKQIFGEKGSDKYTNIFLYKHGSLEK